MSVEFLSGNRRLAYPLVRHGTGGFDVSRLLVDASVAQTDTPSSISWSSCPNTRVHFPVRASGSETVR